MNRFDRSDDGRDSLDRIELEMAIEEVCVDKSLAPGEREALIREILALAGTGDFWDDSNDDDALAILVRKLGPKVRRANPVSPSAPKWNRMESWKTVRNSVHLGLTTA